MLLNESLELLKEICQLKTLPRNIIHIVNEKYLQRYPSYNAVRSVNKYLKGECLELTEVPLAFACKFLWMLNGHSLPKSLSSQMSATSLLPTI